MIFIIYIQLQFAGLRAGQLIISSSVILWHCRYYATYKTLTSLLHLQSVRPLPLRPLSVMNLNLHETLSTLRSFHKICHFAYFFVIKLHFVVLILGAIDSKNSKQKQVIVGMADFRTWPQHGRLHMLQWRATNLPTKRPENLPTRPRRMWRNLYLF